MLVALDCSSTTLPHQRVVSHKNWVPVRSASEDKEPEKSAARGDLFTHKYQQAAEQCGTWMAAVTTITVYNKGPASREEGAEGALPPDHLICCQTVSATFDVVWFLLTEVVYFPLVLTVQLFGWRQSKARLHHVFILEAENYVHRSVWQVCDSTAARLCYKGAQTCSRRSNKCKQAQTQNLQPAVRMEIPP